MKRILLVPTFWVLAFWVLAFWASLIPPSFAASTSEGIKVAVAAAIHGTVQISKADYTPQDRAIGVQLGSGAPIYIGDEITTGPDAGLQVILLDQSVITLGQNGRMVVDDLTFNPQSGDGKLDVDVKDGAFRFISGRIAQAHPDNVSVKVPLASVGIRGTIFGGGPSEAGKASSEGYFVMLLGPGPANNTSAKNGAIDITSQGTTQGINRPGYAVDLSPNQPPSAPHIATPQQQQTMTSVSASAPAPQQQQQQQQQRQGQAPQQPPSSGGGLDSAAAASGQAQASTQVSVANEQGIQSSQSNTNSTVTAAVNAGAINSSNVFSLLTADFTGFGHSSTSGGDASGHSVTNASVNISGSTITGFSGTENSGDGNCTSDNTCAFSHTHSGGSNSTIYYDAYIYLGQWTGGSVVSTLNGAYDSSQSTTLGSGAVIIGGGAPTSLSALPSTGSATYSTVLGSSIINASGTTGTLSSASLTYNFATPSVTTSIVFTLGSYSYTLATTNLSISGNSTASFSASTAASTLSTSGTTDTGVTSAKLVGSLFGSSGQRAGILFGVASSTGNIAGGAALKR